MLDILQATPDLLAQVADSTEFFSEPMRALLDSISAKTGQTAMNTARDSIDWEVIQITRRDYYIAIVAIVVATISLIVDIFTTIYQHTSSSNSKLLSAKLTLSFQKNMAIDMIFRMYRRIIYLMKIKQHLIDNRFLYYPSPRAINSCKIQNYLELDVICSKEPSELKRWRQLCYLLENYNSDCDGLLDTLKSSKIPDNVKLHEISDMIDSLTNFTRMLYNLIYTLSKDTNIAVYIYESIIQIVESLERQDSTRLCQEVKITKDTARSINKIVSALELERYNGTEAFTIVEKDFRMMCSARIGMIPINE